MTMSSEFSKQIDAWESFSTNQKQNLIKYEFQRTQQQTPYFLENCDRLLVFMTMVLNKLVLLIIYSGGTWRNMDSIHGETA